MAGSRGNVIPCMFKALEGFGLFCMPKPAAPLGASNEVVYEIIHPFFSDLDNKYQNAEKELLVQILERGASNIKIADDASDEDRHHLLLLIDYLMTEKVMPAFLQAVVDDDKVTVKAMLDANPEFSHSR